MTEKMVIVVFDETKACEGSRELKQLDSDGSISIHAGTNSAAMG